MLSFLWSLGAFIVALGLLVAVHEWGHFYVARRCGVKVERFSIGFGKPFWRKYDSQGTEYVLAAIPLGGYVKMLDERVDEVKEEDLPYAFNRQPVLNRMAIIAAGPVVNFLFAILALYLMYLIGVDTVKPIVGDVREGSIVEQAQMPVNAEILSIGGRNTPDWEAVNLELISHIGDQSLTMRVKAQAQFEQSLTLDLRNWQFDPDKVSAIASLGMTPFRPDITTELAYIAENSAAERMGLQVNDKILQIDGTPYADWQSIVGYIGSRANQAVQVQVLRNSETLELSGVVGSRETDTGISGYLGVAPKADAWPESYVFTHRYNVINALAKAMDKTWRLMTLSVEMIGKLLTGDVSVKNLSGPISIAQGAGTSAGYGLVYFLSFLALISVNLGIINLLPLPVLDGGHLLYYAIELFTGRPVPESVQEVGFKIGGVALLLLMSIAIFNDIARL